jgi:3-deoxy-D-arabino-heptulosonate 7-phosphate (DAHP) synthase
MGYLPVRNRIAMIHRGVDVAGKGKFRHLPVHDSAEKVKKMTKLKMFFDPSHSFGRFLRDQIVDQTILAMHMKTIEGEYLYDGILIEVGTSITDTEQHITVEELQVLCNEIAKFREINTNQQEL